MQFEFVTPVWKEDGGDVASGPTQSEVHTDKIIGAIHPFLALDQDPRICAKCGMTQGKHNAGFTKGAGFDTPGPDPDSLMNCQSCDGSGQTPNAWDPTDSCPDCGGTGQVQSLEEQQNNSMATPPSPQLWRFQSPEDDVTGPSAPPDPMLQAGNGTLKVPGSISPAGFHEPVWPSGPPNATKSNSQPQRAPRGSESGDVGEWQSSRAFNFVPKGQLVNDLHSQDASQDLPRDPNGNVKQDGPVFGPDNPGMDPGEQVGGKWGSPQATPPQPGESVHYFEQCPQCGTAVTGTEHDCPNPWCGHDLANDPTSSFDNWQEGGTPR